MDKQLVFVKRIEFDWYDLFHGESLDDAIINFNKFKQKLDKEYTYKNMIVGKIRIEHNYDYTESYVDIRREETDEEYSIRIQKELERAEKNRIKKERAAARKAEQIRQAELKELAELEELRKRVAELEQKHNK